MEEKIQEVMGLVKEFAMHIDVAARLDEVGQYANADDSEAKAWQTKDAIEAKLRKLVERKPLSEERIWEIEADSYVESRRPEYTKDCFGDDKTIWHETKNFSFPLFARNIERAHKIGA